MTIMHISPNTHKFPFDLGGFLTRIDLRSRIRNISLFGVIIVVALLAFELFNFSTTEFALNDLLGSLTFIGLRWSIILALAFCGMDFAGIARLLTFDRRKSRSFEVWYLLGAWLLAAAMNAMLSWWSVSLALISHEGLGNEVLGREVLVSTVPVFVALLVVLLRILIIGTLTLAGSSIFINQDSHSTAKPAARSAVPEKEDEDKAPSTAHRRSYPMPPASGRIPARTGMTARAANRR